MLRLLLTGLALLAISLPTTLAAQVSLPGAESSAVTQGGSPETEQGPAYESGQTLETSWTDAHGLTHTVRTPVPPTTKPDLYLKRHIALVEAYQVLYPPAPPATAPAMSVGGRLSGSRTIYSLREAREWYRRAG